LVLVHGSTSAVVHDLVNNDKVGNASPNVPSPLLAVVLSVSSKETGQDHDDIGYDCNKNIGTAETSQKAEIEQEKRGCNAPVNISCPVDLSVCDLFRVWETVLVADSLLAPVEVDTIASGHGKVGEEGEGGDECSQDMEETFLLGAR